MAFFVCTIFQGGFMESNERLVLRLPSDLKAMFTALCESENITVSAKIKKLMADEIQQKLNRAMFHQTQLEMMPRTHKKPPISHSDDVQATTLLDNNQTSLKTQNSAVSVDLVKNPMQSAMNAQNKRKTKKKKR